MKKIFFLPLVILFISCSSDDGSNSDPNDDDIVGLNTLEEMIQDITSGSERTWFVQNATLTNDNVTNLNVTFAFNIEDDEFVFSDNNDLTLSLEWRKNNSINNQASTFDEVLVDYLRSPENAALSFNNDTDYFNNNFSDSTNKFNIGYIDDSVLEGIIDYGNNAMLSFTLVPKTVNDYKSAPTQPLIFQELFNIDGQFSSHLGFNLSKSKSTLFIAHKIFADNNIPDNGTMLYGFDLNSNTLNEKFTTSNPGYSSKRIAVIEDEVLVLDGAFFSRYNLNDLQEDPIVVQLDGSRIFQEIEAYDDDLFVVGGSLTAIDGENAANADIVYKFNTATAQFNVDVEMPVKKFDADGAIVNNKLYIFGGGDLNTAGTDDIIIYDLSSGSIDTSLHMPSIVYDTFVSVYDNLIYVGGRRPLDANENPAPFTNADHYSSYLGVFNTLNNTFTELDINVPDDGEKVLIGMKVFDDKLYIVHGGFDLNVGSRIFTVQVANLD